MLTDTQRTILSAARVAPVVGAEVLDTDLTVIADISDEISDARVVWNRDARIHATCTVTLTTELEWDAVFLRLFVTYDDERFDVGVYCMVIPERPVGADPVTFEVTGEDRVFLLDRQVGADFEVAEGTTFYAAIVAVFAAAGLSGYWIDSEAADKTLDADWVWPLVGRRGTVDRPDPDQAESDQPVTWLRILNDLLDAINFGGVYADGAGRYRCHRYINPAQRAPEYVFDADDPTVSIVDAEEDRRVILNGWRTPNRWVGIASNPPDGVTPSTGNGYVQEAEAAETGAWGLDWPSVLTLQTESTSALAAQVERAMNADLRRRRTFEATTGFVGFTHAPVFTYRDVPAGGTFHVVATEAEFDLAAGLVSWKWEQVNLL